jgi:hypothetical protein
MPTINQLVRRRRVPQHRKSKSPALKGSPQLSGRVMSVFVRTRRSRIRRKDTVVECALVITKLLQPIYLVKIRIARAHDGPRKRWEMQGRCRLSLYCGPWST